MQGQRCSKPYCEIKKQPGSQLISLQLLPPADHRYKDNSISVLKQQFINIPLNAITNKTIQTRQAYNVLGEVYINSTSQGKTKTTSVPSRIRFTDKESIQGQALVWEVTTDARQGNSGRYQQRLSYGAYEVEIIPTSSNLPPHRIPQQIITGPQTLNFRLPDEKDYPKIKGRILSAESSPIPIPGLSLQVINSKGLPVSNKATSNAKGEFLLWLSRGEYPHFIRIDMQTKSNPHPQIDIPCRPKIVGKGQVIDLGDLRVGYRKPPILVEGTVQVRPQDGIGTKVANAHIRIYGKVETGIYGGQMLKGTYQVDVLSDQDGRYEAIILPGSYQFEVIPPPHSDRARALIVPLKNPFLSDQVQNIELSPKRNVVGKVCETSDKGSCAKEVPLTQIQTIWRKSLESKREQSPSTATPSTFFRQVIGKNGWYSIPLDPGYYDFIYIPPKESGLARIIHSNIKIQSAENQPYVRPDALLPNADHLIGQIIGPERFPIPNVTVEIYAPSSPSSKEPQHLLGRAITNSQGLFSIPYHIVK